MKTKLIEFLADWTEKVHGTRKSTSILHLNKDNVKINLDGNIVTVDTHKNNSIMRKVFFKLKYKVIFLEERILHKDIFKDNALFKIN